ncbi:MAG: hypothetical protein ACYST0_10560 [Planctomycetota bacterium]|jgi:hypothetical protein
MKPQTMKLRRVVAIAVVAVAAVALVVLPWLPWPQAMELPAEFTSADPAFGVLTRLALEVDHVCGNGDVAGVESRITPAFRAELALRLAGTGKSINSRTLRDTRVLIGELRGQDLRAAHASADHAVLIFRQRDYGPRARDFLLGVVFAWDGYRFLVHGTRFRALASLDGSEAQGVRQMAAELLESRHGPR